MKRSLLIFALIIITSGCSNTLSKLTDILVGRPVDKISTTNKKSGIKWSHPHLQGNGLMAISKINFSLLSVNSHIFAVGEAGTILAGPVHRSPWSQAFDPKVINIWLSDIWTGDNSIFICGYNGTIIENKYNNNHDNYYDNEITTHTTNITNDLNAIWGSTSKSVFAVGDRGTIIHYDGTSWKLMDSGTDNLLFDIWGSADNDVYAAGGRGTLLHWDGIKWETITIADEDIHITKLWGDSNNNIYAGGTGGKLFHFDGKIWQTIDLPSDRLVRDIEGYNKKIFVLLEPNIVAVYDGQGWRQEMAGGNYANLKDMEIQNGYITIVGDGGAIISKLNKWINWNKGSLSDITKIINISDNNFYAAGDKILKYRGEEGWVEETNPLSGKIRAVYKKGNDMIVAGDGGEIAILKDNKWQKYPNADFDIYGIAERGERLYIIGKEGHLAYYDEKASTWTAVDTKTDKDLKGIYVDDKGIMYIAGNGGTILKVDDSGVDIIDSHVEEDLYDINGDGNDNIYIAGNFGTLFRYSSGAWEKVETNTTATLRSIVIMKDKIIAGGDSGTIIVKDSDGVKDFSDFTSNTIRDIVIKDNQSVFLAGDNGTILEMGW